MRRAMTLPVARAKGKIFTIDIQFDVSGIPEDASEFQALFYMTVTPSVTAIEDFFEGILPDMEWVRLYLTTPNYSLFYGWTGQLGWTQSEFEAYMQEGAEQMARIFDNLEQGVLFTAPSLFNPDYP